MQWSKSGNLSKPEMGVGVNKAKLLYVVLFFLLVTAMIVWPVLAEETEIAGESQATEPQYSKSTTLAEFEQEYQENGFVRLPDLTPGNGWKYLTTKPPKDIFKSIPGAETTEVGYKKGNTILVTSKLPNGKIYKIGVIERSAKKAKQFSDEYNDGYFEQMGEKFIIDSTAYGI